MHTVDRDDEAEAEDQKPGASMHERNGGCRAAGTEEQQGRQEERTRTSTLHVEGMSQRKSQQGARVTNIVTVYGIFTFNYENTAETSWKHESIDGT